MNTERLKKDIPAFILSILIAQSAGLLGAIFTAPAIETWYAGLQKPWFTPPGWVFGPAWTVLYILMGTAAFRIWRKRELRAARGALYLYALQLALNAFWSVIFFGMRLPGAALAEIMVLLAAIIVLTVKFYRIDKAAGIILIPYLAWVSFAAVLNYSIFVLNR